MVCVTKKSVYMQKKCLHAISYLYRIVFILHHSMLQFKVYPITDCHANILPSTGHEKNIPQPKATSVL